MSFAIVFDDGLGVLAPLTDLRPAFDVRTGALSTLDRLRRSLRLGILGLVVPAELQPIARATHALPVNDPNLDLAPAGAGPVTLINGRLALPGAPLEALLAEAMPGTAIVEPNTGHLVAAMVDAKAARAFVGGERVTPARAQTVPGPCLLSRPWSVRAWRDRALQLDLRLLATGHPTAPRPGVLVIGDNPLTLHPSATVYPGATLDLEHGPIVVDERAVIRPGAIVIGPAYVGPNATILERATIRPFTSIGPWCKVNGEVGGTIFQGFANKSHDGYVGDSYIGEWVNLGAGTTTSNLLNTYAEVIARAAPDAKNERTGETFLGAIVGDHVKTAIATRLMTGCVLHSGSMFATTAPVAGCVPAFTWATDEPGSLAPSHREYRLDKFLEVMRAAMARRKVEPSAAYLDRMAALHARSR